MRPIHKIFLHHSGTDPEKQTWDQIRAFHMRPKSEGGRGWDDIGYHYGVVFDQGEFKIRKGRSEDVIGAQVYGHNTDSIGIMVEGNFQKRPPFRAQVEMAYSLVVSMVGRFNLGPDDVLGHREAPYDTLCPGKYFPINEIRGRLIDFNFSRS